MFADRLPPFLRTRIAAADGAASLSARLLSVTPAVAAPFVDPQTLEELGGRIDATVQLEADRASLDRVRGTVALDRAELALGGVPFDQQVPTRLVDRRRPADGRRVGVGAAGTTGSRFAEARRSAPTRLST